MRTRRKMRSIQIEKLSPGDTRKFTALLRIFEAVFEMMDLRMPGESHLRRLLHQDAFFVFVALEDGEVTGGLTSYLLQQYYVPAPLVYIYDLAVSIPYQRQGIGRQLIAAHNAYCRSIGAGIVMVEAEAADRHAVDFYRATGARGEKVIHFDYTLDEKK